MKGFRIRVSVYFAVLIACILVMDPTGVAMLALLCAAFHEAGHCIALFVLGVPVEEVSFRVFGINIRLLHNERISYRQEIGIALAGCAANLAVAGVALIVWAAGIFVNQTMTLMVMNLIICLFNALPIGPLDGGRALEAMLCRHLEPLTAQRIVNTLSFLFLLPLILLGFLVVVRTGYNFSLILAAVYLLAAITLKGKLIEFR